MDLSGIDTVEQPVDTTGATDSGRRPLRRVVCIVAIVAGLSAAALALLALAQAAVDAGLAGSAWDVVDLGR